MAEKLDIPPATSNPLFPPMPEYGSPTLLRKVKWSLLQILSLFLYINGLIVIAAAILISLLKIEPKPARSFQIEENRRRLARRDAEVAWKKRKAQVANGVLDVENGADLDDGFIPTEGGPDSYVRDVGHYAKRVGLDSETFKVQTEDGHILTMWHIFDPREYTPLSEEQRAIRGPECIDSIRPPSRELRSDSKFQPKYPVLLLHGLLQSSGVYCTNDEHSLAFWLCKQGYDVWLGNNRAGFKAEHVSLSSSDPNMWAWNIRHMGLLDLPALTARVLSETAFKKLGLIAHSQGTTQTLLSLSTTQRPSLGNKLSIFCALAPAAYAGPMLSSPFFKLARQMSTSYFRLVFGLTSFLPLVSLVNISQRLLPSFWIGYPAFWVYNWVFGWGDTNWDRGTRDRCFMWAPTFISAEAMFWWLSRGGFADEGSILDAREVLGWEEEEDALKDYLDGLTDPERPLSRREAELIAEKHEREAKKGGPWYDKRSPPMAFWVAGRDDLVDGARLLNRFRRGREPDARVVHEKVLAGYEHLDVVWSCDVIEKVGFEVRDWVWKTCEVRDKVRVPNGCGGLDGWVDDRVIDGKVVNDNAAYNKVVREEMKRKTTGEEWETHLTFSSEDM